MPLRSIKGLARINKVVSFYSYVGFRSVDVPQKFSHYVKEHSVVPSLGFLQTKLP